MALFKYIARDSEGKRFSGSEEASSTNALIERLSQKGYIVTKIEPTTMQVGGATQWSAPSFAKKVSEEVFIFFSLQLADMLEAGLPLLAYLNNMINQIKSNYFKKVLNAIATNIEEGKSFSESAAQFPHIFSDLFISLVIVGETSGTLDQMLARIAKLLEDQLDLKRKVKSAITYPIILIIVSIIVVGLMITMVVPSFVALFGKAGIPLPWPTRFLYGISQICRKYWLIIMTICFLIFVVLTFLKKTKAGKRFFDLLKLKIPVFGSLIKKVIMSRWTRTLGTLIGEGVPILQGLTIAKQSVANAAIQEKLDEVYLAIERGGRLGDAIRQEQEFPPEVIQMVTVGEESGTLDKMLMRISDFYDKMIAYQVKRMSDLIEPFFLIFVGVIVGFIMISVLLPIFDMIKVVQGKGV